MAPSPPEAAQRPASWLPAQLSSPGRPGTRGNSRLDSPFLTWSALGPHSISNRWSLAGTSGHCRRVRIAGQRPSAAPTSDGEGSCAWVRIPPPPPSWCAVCAGQSAFRLASEGAGGPRCSPFAHNERQKPKTRLAPPLLPGGLTACHGVHRPPSPRADRLARQQKGRVTTEAAVSREPGQGPPASRSSSMISPTRRTRSYACDKPSPR
jgi:hypothetical protein